jgi:hypothetical protein
MMSTQEIESAIERLSPSEIAELAEWFQEFQARVWDEQIESDSRTGRLDTLIQETEKEHAAGRYREL